MAFVHDKKLSQLDGPSVYAAWRAQCLRRLASPVFTPLGEPSVYAAWRLFVVYEGRMAQKTSYKSTLRDSVRLRALSKRGEGEQIVCD